MRSSTQAYRSASDASPIVPTAMTSSTAIRATCAGPRASIRATARLRPTMEKDTNPGMSRYRGRSRSTPVRASTMSPRSTAASTGSAYSQSCPAGNDRAGRVTESAVIRYDKPYPEPLGRGKAAPTDGVEARGMRDAGSPRGQQRAEAMTTEPSVVLAPARGRPARCPRGRRDHRQLRAAAEQARPACQLHARHRQQLSALRPTRGGFDGGGWLAGFGPRHSGACEASGLQFSQLLPGRPLSPIVERGVVLPISSSGESPSRDD